jgi:hypothetical protein
VGVVPLVKLGLQAIALGQQGCIFGGQVGHNGVEALPKMGTADAGARQHLGLNELVQRCGHLQLMLMDARRSCSGHFLMRPEIREWVQPTGLAMQTLSCNFARWHWV